MNKVFLAFCLFMVCVLALIIFIVLSHKDIHPASTASKLTDAQIISQLAANHPLWGKEVKPKDDKLWSEMVSNAHICRDECSDYLEFDANKDQESYPIVVNVHNSVFNFGYVMVVGIVTFHNATHTPPDLRAEIGYYVKVPHGGLCHYDVTGLGCYRDHKGWHRIISGHSSSYNHGKLVLIKAHSFGYALSC